MSHSVAVRPGESTSVLSSPWVAVDAQTIPAKHARELRDAWEDFVEGRVADEGAGASNPEIREPIADSWQRSRDAGVRPIGRQSAPSVLERGGAQERWEAHPLAAASALIERCLDEVSGGDNLVVVADAEGMLLRVSGGVALRSRAADDMNFVEGALWSETAVGTNAIGTALAATHAVQVFAAEHFTEVVQRWTCAAAPIRDPETGQLLAVIDLTGDSSTVQAHSLSVVVATARAVEALLQVGLARRDGELLARHLSDLGPAGVGAALVTGIGRIVHDPRGYWPSGGADPIPYGGGTILLPSGAPASAEPLDDGDVYLIRPVSARGRTASAPQLQVRLLGDDPEKVRLNGVAVHLRPRHVELLALLLDRPHRVSADVLCTELYGEDGHPSSIRVEMSRLRRLLPGIIESDAYRLRAHVDSDVQQLESLLEAGSARDAVAAYPGPLLPGSCAPGIVRRREYLEAWLHQAVITSDDPDALWGWVQTTAGEEDLIAWRRLLAALDYSDGRRSLAVARIAELTRSFASGHPPVPPSL